MKSYAEKLRDPRWQMRRLEVMKNNKAKCAYCNSGSKQLHIHHIVYIRGREPWEYSDDELTCVCFECHEKIEAAKAWIARMFGHAIQENWMPLAKAIETIYSASNNYLQFQTRFNAWLKKTVPKKRRGK